MLNDRKWLGLFWRRWKSGFNTPQLFFFDSVDSHTPCMNWCKFSAKTAFCTEDTLNEVVYMVPYSLVGCYSVLKICIYFMTYMSLYIFELTPSFASFIQYLFNNSFYTLSLLSIFYQMPCQVKGSFPWTLYTRSIDQHGQGRQDPCAQPACQNPIM